MDSTRFDELTKALATSPSRRQIFKTLVATALGGLLGLGGVDTALKATKSTAAGQSATAQMPVIPSSVSSSEFYFDG
jgi:hypothetical protein